MGVARARLGQEVRGSGRCRGTPGVTAAGDVQVADDEAGAIAQALETNPVYRAPGTEQWLSNVDAAELQEAIVDADLPVYIVLVPPPDGIRGGDDLLTLVAQARQRENLEDDGLYIGINSALSYGDREPYQPYAGTVQFHMAIKHVGDGAPWSAPDAESLDQHVDTFLSYGNNDGDGTPFPLAEGLDEVVDLLAAGDLTTIEEVGREGLFTERPAAGDSSGTGSETGLFVPIASAVVGVALLGVVVTRLRRRRTSAPRDRRTFALPDSVLSRVREAEADELRRRARAALVSLGEKIEGAQVGPRDDTATWQAALDHYEAAGRLVPDDGTEPSVLDAVGALVLVDRGEQAMTATRRRKKLVFSTPCFLNPLHGVGRRGESLAHGDFRVDAPVCDRCRADLKAGRRPDILDVVENGKPEHYFETRHEPWASTGYGALEPDLLRRLRTRR